MLRPYNHGRISTGGTVSTGTTKDAKETEGTKPPAPSPACSALYEKGWDGLRVFRDFRPFVIPHSGKSPLADGGGRLLAEGAGEVHRRQQPVAGDAQVKLPGLQVDATLP